MFVAWPAPQGFRCLLGLGDRGWGVPTVWQLAGQHQIYGKEGRSWGSQWGVIYAEITQNYGRKGIWGSSQTSEGLADDHLGWGGGCRDQQELPRGRCRVGAMAWPRK